MYYLLWPFQLLYKLYYLVVFSLLMLISYPFYLYWLSDQRRFPSAFRIMKIHAHVLLALTGIFLMVKGATRIPKDGAYIICANHSSFLDSFCLYSIISRYFVFTGKKEIEKWPLFHIFYTSGMNIMIDRRSAAGSLGALKRMTKELTSGHPLAIFPEGTRSAKAPMLAPFKTGAFALAIQLQIPVVPVSFINNWKRLGPGGLLGGRASPGTSKVVIHPPVPTIGLGKDDIDLLRWKVKEIISGPLTAR